MISHEIDLIVIDCSINFGFLYEYSIVTTAISVVFFAFFFFFRSSPHIHYFHYLNEFHCPPNTFACTLLNYFPFCLLWSVSHSIHPQTQSFSLYIKLFVFLNRTRETTHLLALIIYATEAFIMNIQYKINWIFHIGFHNTMQSDRLKKKKEKLNDIKSIYVLN